MPAACPLPKGAIPAAAVPCSTLALTGLLRSGLPWPWRGDSKEMFNPAETPGSMA